MLHPLRHGPISHQAHRLGWRTLRALSRGPTRRRLLTAAGPLAMATHFVAWIGGLWVGFALIYRAGLESFATAPGVSFGATGWLEAFYISGESLTTVGYGDVVADSDALRIATVLESAAGLVLVGCAVTYLLSVYPIVARLAGAARRVEGFGADGAAGAALLVRDGGRGAVARLQDDLIDVLEQVRRYPVVDYFRPAHGLSAPLALVRAGAVVHLVLVAACPREAGDWAPTYGRAIGRTLGQLRQVYLADGLVAPHPPASIDDSHAEEALAGLRAAVAEATGGVAEPTTPPGELRTDIARLQGFVDALAVAHGYPPHALLPGLPEHRHPPASRHLGAGIR